jgi:hypothetical protein
MTSESACNERPNLDFVILERTGSVGGDAPRASGAAGQDACARPVGRARHG